MNIHPLAAAAAALLIVGGCANGDDTLGPATSFVETRSSDRPAFAARRVEAAGAFAANVNFSTLRLTPRGVNCLLEVEGRAGFYRNHPGHCHRADERAGFRAVRGGRE